MLRRECCWQEASCTHHPASDHIGPRLGDKLVKLACRGFEASRLEVLVMLMCMPVPGLAARSAPWPAWPKLESQVFVVSNSHGDLSLSRLLRSTRWHRVRSCSLRTSAAFGASSVFDSYRPVLARARLHNKGEAQHPTMHAKWEGASAIRLIRLCFNNQEQKPHRHQSKEARFTKLSPGRMRWQSVHHARLRPQ